MSRPLDEIVTFVDFEPDPGGWIPKARGSRNVPPRYSARSARGRSTVTVTTVPLSPEVVKRQAKRRREAAERVAYLEALAAAGVELSPSLRRYI